jgi:hypothetical protein
MNGLHGKDVLFRTLNPLMPEVNSSAQRRLTRFFTGDFAP